MSEGAMPPVEMTEPGSRDSGPVAMLLRPRAATRAHIEAGRWWPALAVFAASGLLISPSERSLVVDGWLPHSDEQLTLADASRWAHESVVLAVSAALAVLMLALMYHVIGRLMRGAGRYEDMLIAAGVGYLPMISLHLVGWICFLIPDDVLGMALMLGLSVPIMLWTITRTASCLAVAHRFGLWRSLGTALGGFVACPLILLGPLILFGLALVMGGAIGAFDPR